MTTARCPSIREPGASDTRTNSWRCSKRGRPIARDRVDIIRGAIDARLHPARRYRRVARAPVPIPYDGPWSVRRRGNVDPRWRLPLPAHDLAVVNGPLVPDGGKAYRDGSAGFATLFLSVVLLLLGSGRRCHASEHVARRPDGGRDRGDRRPPVGGRAVDDATSVHRSAPRHRDRRGRGCADPAMAPDGRPVAGRRDLRGARAPRRRGDQVVPADAFPIAEPDIQFLMFLLLRLSGSRRPTRCSVRPSRSPIQSATRRRWHEADGMRDVVPREPPHPVQTAAPSGPLTGPSIRALREGQVDGLTRRSLLRAAIGRGSVCGRSRSSAGRSGSPGQPSPTSGQRWSPGPSPTSRPRTPASRSATAFRPTSPRPARSSCWSTRAAAAGCRGRPDRRRDCAQRPRAVTALSAPRLPPEPVHRGLLVPLSVPSVALRPARDQGGRGAVGPAPRSMDRYATSSRCRRRV